VKEVLNKIKILIKRLLYLSEYEDLNIIFKELQIKIENGGLLTNLGLCYYLKDKYKESYLKVIKRIQFEEYIKK